MQKDLLVEIKNLWKSYKLKVSLFKRKKFWALQDINLIIKKNETIALLGESGSGKSTLAKIILGIEKPDKGIVKTYTFIQAVFQDPYSSLNPKMKIKDILLEPYLINIDKDKNKGLNKALELLEQVGLSKKVLNLYPHNLSGGERQRIALARALITNPELIILDEPTSSLDVSVEAQIIRILQNLKQKKSFFLITHNFRLAKLLGDKVMVIYKGKILEVFAIEYLNSAIHHPYTEILIKACLDPFSPTPPEFDRVENLLKEEKINGEKGCVFYARCPIKSPKCMHNSPTLQQIAPNHYIACFNRY